MAGTTEQPDPGAPFERCGYTVQRSSSVLADQLDMVRIAKDGWATYVTAEFYDDFAGDDEAFGSLMDAQRAAAEPPKG